MARQVGQAKTDQCGYFTSSVQPLTSMIMNPTDTAEICSVKFCRLKENKSPRYYAISSKTVEAVALYISNPLCEVFNISLLIGEFPENLKIAKVIPVLKAEDKLCKIITDKYLFICFL